VGFDDAEVFLTGWRAGWPVVPAIDPRRDRSSASPPRFFPARQRLPAGDALSGQSV